MTTILLSPYSVAADDYTQSFSGNVRVEALSKISPNGDTSSNTLFGGDEEESTIGGDTYFQWNHAFKGDASAASAFIRFASDGNMRFNIESYSELGNYRGDIKAEWEIVDGFGVGRRVVSRRDEFVKLTHTGIGAYYKIGREEWLGKQKGYASDFLSKTKGYADAGFGDSRFVAHAVGWSRGNTDFEFLFQRDGGTSLDAVPLGVDTGGGSTAASVIISAGLLLDHTGKSVDLGFSIASGIAGDVSQGGSVSIVELQVARNLGNIRPFFNIGLQSTMDGVTNSELTQIGTNLGVGTDFGHSDLIFALGSSSISDPGRGDTAENLAGVDLIWATKQDPLKVSIALASDSGTATSFHGEESDLGDTQYGVRLDFGF